MSVNHQTFERKLRRLKRHACLSDGKNKNHQPNKTKKKKKKKKKKKY